MLATACVNICPQHIIHLWPLTNSVDVQCSNQDNGKTAQQVCVHSCIGCGICEKVCLAGAIHVVEHCARIQQKYRLSCSMCATKCPRNAILETKGILSKQ